MKYLEIEERLSESSLFDALDNLSGNEFIFYGGIYSMRVAEAIMSDSKGFIGYLLCYTKEYNSTEWSILNKSGFIHSTGEETS